MAEPGRPEYEFINKPTFYLHEAVISLAHKKDDLVSKFAEGFLTAGWTGQNLLEAFEEKFGARTGGLITAIKIVKGEKPVMAINTEQILPFYALYDISSFDLANSKVYCTVGIDNNEPSPKLIQAEMRWFHRPGIPDDVLISQGLGRALKVKDGDNVVIWNVQSDETEVDLDK